MVYGVIYGLDIVVLEFTRPLCFFCFLFSLLTITPEERGETKPSVCGFFGFLLLLFFLSDNRVKAKAVTATASMTTVVVLVVTTWFLI